MRADVARQLEIDARYRGYLSRQEADIRTQRADASVALPTDLDWISVSALSMEMRQKLAAVRPANLAQASRIPGITPAALAILLRFARRAA
jgi:tRNA uridine 5-carboxymethylaminomethyl modification enzyme